MNKLTNKIPPILFIIILSILGYIVGVCITAFWQENWLICDEILGQEFVCRIEDLSIDKRAYFLLCVGKRFRAFLLLFLLSFSSVNVFANVCFFFITGIYSGCMMEMFVIRYGVQGIFMYLSLVLPQAFFYIPGYFSLGCWCLNRENIQGSIRDKKKEKIRHVNMKRIFYIIIFIIMGTILESFVNTKIFLLLI